jgi:hypothetical protein
MWSAAAWPPHSTSQATSIITGAVRGFRIIYYWHSARQIFLMLYLYSKAEQGDLTAAQRRTLGKVIDENVK